MSSAATPRTRSEARLNTIPVYILSGGKSSRFGSDKALATVEGKTLLERIARSVESIASPLTIVADLPDKYAALGFRTIADFTPDSGPLGGLEAALVDAGTTPWVIVLSCDLIEMSVTWLHALLNHADSNVQAVAFKPDRWQPLVAAYHTSALPTVQSQLRSGQRRMQDLLNLIRTREAPLPADWPERLQANYRSDLPAKVDPGERNSSRPGAERQY